MAVRASVTITLSCYRDTEAVVRYYLLQSSTLDAPAKPTAYPPGGDWDDTEPGYEEGSTSSLYFVDCSVFSDGTWLYSSVSLSSSYEAAKEAYNKAVAAANAAAKKNTVYWQTAAPSEETFQTNDLWFDTGNGNTLYYWTGAAWQKAPFGAASIDVDELFAQDITATGSITGVKLISLNGDVAAWLDNGQVNVGVNGTDFDTGEQSLTQRGAIYYSEDYGYTMAGHADCPTTILGQKTLWLYGQATSLFGDLNIYSYGAATGKLGVPKANVEIGSDTRTDYVGAQVQNSVRNGVFEVSAAGNLGVWDATNSNWMIRSGTDQDVYIPHPLYVEGTQVPTVVSGTTSTTTVAAGSYTDISVTFGHTFSSAPVVQISPIWNTTSTNSHYVQFTVTSRSTTGCTIRILNGHTASFSPAVMWTAIGT